MKKLLPLIILLFLSQLSYAQRNVNGLVLKTNGDSVNGVVVHIYPDTTSGPLTFQPMKDTTQSGSFSFVLPANVPLGSVFKVSTLDCDSTSYKTNTHIYAGNNINSNLIVCVAPPRNFSGYVFLGDSTKRPQPQQAMVYLISKCNGNVLTYIDSVLTDTNGYYKVDSFPTLTTGCEVIMKARLLPVAQEYKKYLPAYHESNNSTYALRWFGGREIPLQVAKGGINLLLPEAINPTGGPSSIGGYAVDSATVTVLSDYIMFITDMNDVPVDYTYTHQTGTFLFGNLPFGTYKVFGDVWGKDNLDLTVQVSANHVNEFNIIFTEYKHRYEGRIATSVTGNNHAINKLAIYPNPAQDYVIIKGAEAIKGSKQVNINSIDGRTIQTTEFADGDNVKINISNLVPGTYILNIMTEDGNAVFRMMK